MFFAYNFTDISPNKTLGDLNQYLTAMWVQVPRFSTGPEDYKLYDAVPCSSIYGTDAKFSD